MRTLITGNSGFVGSSLAERLISDGWEVTGFDLRQSGFTPRTYIGNIHDENAVAAAIKISQPDVIFHFAGLIKTVNPLDYYTTNVQGTLSLFKALVKLGTKPRVVIASSSAVYGPGVGKRPITEKFALRPVTDYAASKAAQEFVAHRFFLAYNIPVIILRTFNLIGPGQPPDLACSAFARQIALDEIKPKPAPIKTGNLNSQRDFVDVRDAVLAYEQLSIKGKPGRSYNICSGLGVSIQQCLDILISLASKSLVAEIDNNKLQRNDVPIQVGSNRLVHRAIGWLPQIPLEQSLLDLLNDWRNRLRTTSE